MKRNIIGLTENVLFKGPEKEKEIRARIDSGADVCSMDKALAKELGLKPHKQKSKIRSAHGSKERDTARVRIEIKKRKFKNIRFTLADRSHMRFKALIGKNILKKGFLIDPMKK